MWFKYGLKAQKLLAQGIALGIMAISKAPCKGKSFVYCQIFESFCPFRACGGLLAKLELYNSAKKTQWSFSLWIFLAQNLALICFLMFM